MLLTAPPSGTRMDLGAGRAMEELPMQMITTIGLDIAKSGFQMHGVDAAIE
jgi:hypothetical protein